MPRVVRRDVHVHQERRFPEHLQPLPGDQGQPRQNFLKEKAAVYETQDAQLRKVLEAARRSTDGVEVRVWRRLN